MGVQNRLVAPDPHRHHLVRVMQGILDALNCEAEVMQSIVARGDFTSFERLV